MLEYGANLHRKQTFVKPPKIHPAVIAALENIDKHLLKHEPYEFYSGDLMNAFFK
jgi:hypothetical protein